MNTYTIIPAQTEEEIETIAVLASQIWHQHFTPIIGKAQVNYMVDKFQSFPALKQQVADGYEYFQIYSDDTLAGYTGIRQDKDALFLSKLYLRQDCRGQGLSRRAFEFLIDLCKKRELSCIWLTCNKYNADTLAVYDRFGFVKTDEQVADIGNGYVMDDYILTYYIV